MYVFVAADIQQYSNIDTTQVTPQYGVRKGVEVFGDDGVKAVLKELKQLNDRSMVTPIHPRNMTREELKRSLQYLMFLKQKRCEKIKGRDALMAVHNGSSSRKTRHHRLHCPYTH